MADQQPVPDRDCGTCTTCCQVLRIEALDKPELTACPHMRGGCTIYPDRPAACRDFFCGWRVLPFVGAHWFPPDSGMMVFPLASARRLTVHVDPARPQVWQAEPFRSDLARWALAAEQTGLRLTVMVGRAQVAVLAGG